MPGVLSDLKTISTLHFTLFVLFALAAALWCFWLVWKNFRSARIIEDTPTAKVRSAPQGYVELEGTARCFPGQQVLAPLTGLPCVWYSFRIDEERRGSRNSTTWVEVESGTSEIPFCFYDDTGECLVDPRGADVTESARKTWYGSSQRPTVGAQKRGLFGFLVGRRYRYRERRLDEGYLYLLGWFDTIRSTDSKVSDEVLALLRQWKQDQGNLLGRFDGDGNGRIDGAEWAQARQSAHREVVQDRARRSAEPALNCVRAGESDDYPFLMAARPQPLLSARYRRRALAALAGFSIACAALLVMFSVRF